MPYKRMLSRVPEVGWHWLITWYGGTHPLAKDMPAAYACDVCGKPDGQDWIASYSIAVFAASPLDNAQEAGVKENMIDEFGELHASGIHIVGRIVLNLWRQMQVSGGGSVQCAATGLPLSMWHDITHA